MAESYIFPTIVSLPIGYICTVPHPYKQIGERIVVRDRNVPVTVNLTATRDGGEVWRRTDELVFYNGRLVNEVPAAVRVDAFEDRKGSAPGFLEMAVEIADEAPAFSTKAVLGLYSIYTRKGAKTFFSDNAYKYGAPPIISMIARFKRYVDGYPVVHIDRERYLGETLVLINPYKKPILAEIRTADGRKMGRKRIGAECVSNVDLSQLLTQNETSWRGQIQLTANNRLITFSIKHRLGDVTDISDHEHLDPFRSDPTFQPTSLQLRQWTGGKLRKFRQS